MKYFIFTFLLSLGAFQAFAQNDSINVLEEVLLSSKKLEQFSTGQSLTTFTDSTFIKNDPLLTSFLNYNTPVYFKENGLGMVSSPSFRGTTAQQTAVVWNGININSQFNGQTDFNTLSIAGYDEVSVKPGGGSVLYGTGAIGGTIHLHNSFDFDPKHQHQVHFSYGSYNTYDARYGWKLSKNNWSVAIDLSRNQSENDYEYPDDKGKNRNGQFYQQALNTNIGYQINKKNTLKFYSQFIDGERHFSLIRKSDTKTKYQDINNRNLLEWERSFGKFLSVTRAAYLEERYKYFGNLSTQNYSFAEAKTYIGKYDLQYKPTSNSLINGIASYQNTQGKGSSLGNNKREVTSFSLLGKHQLSPKLTYDVAFRKEISHSYESPLLYSLGVIYDIASFYDLKLNFSKNFRMPTFNDLYWEGSGNTSLKAEQSHQVEVGNIFKFKNASINITGFYNDINDMIRWLPSNNSVWVPDNVDAVKTYGGELLADYSYTWSQQKLAFASTFSYTISENTETSKFLTYVPKTKITFSAIYEWHRWFLDYKFLYTGEVFTRTDNNSKYNLDAYTVSNLGAGFQLDKNNNKVIGIRTKNIFNKAYQSVENRYMPGFNLNFYITLNF
jgi:vitamin B12 transporter